MISRTLFDRIVLSLVLCLGMARLYAQTNAPAPLAGAIITDWTGKVEVQLPGKPFAKPQRGQMLPEGTIITSGDGRVLLTIRLDESNILVRPQTRIVLTQPSSTNWNSLEVLLGRIRLYIQKRTGGAPPFQLGTPSAVAAVRGTRFDVEVNRLGTTEVDVFDGLVEVAGQGVKGKSVLVHPGFSTRVAMGGAPEAPVPTREIRPDVPILLLSAYLSLPEETRRWVDLIVNKGDGAPTLLRRVEELLAGHSGRSTER